MIVAERGHHCLYALHGGRCPGAPSCSTADDVRDGVRCPRCGRWAEKADRMKHTDPLCEENKRRRR